MGNVAGMNKKVFDRIRLRELRRAKKIKGIEFAKRIDCSNDHLSRVENGGTSPSRKLVERMAKVLAVPAESLYVVEAMAGAQSTRSREENELLDALRRLSPQQADYVVALALSLANGGSLDAAAAAAQGYMAVQESRRASAAQAEKPARRGGTDGRQD